MDAKETRVVFSVLTVNHPGVLLRVTGLFSRRGFNIDSIVACSTEKPEFSRWTLVVTGDEATFTQLLRQLLKYSGLKQPFQPPAHFLRPGHGIFAQVSRDFLKHEVFRNPSLIRPIYRFFISVKCLRINKHSLLCVVKQILGLFLILGKELMEQFMMEEVNIQAIQSKADNIGYLCCYFFRPFYSSAL